jgi:hypothetical protein
MSRRDKEIVALAALGTVLGTAGPVALLIAGVVGLWSAIALQAGIAVSAWIVLQIAKSSGGRPAASKRISADT